MQDATSRLLKKQYPGILRRRKNTLEFSQTGIAEAVGVSQAAVNGWENDRLPDLCNHFRLCELLGLEFYNSVGAILNFPAAQSTLIGEEVGREDALEAVAHFNATLQKIRKISHVNAQLISEEVDSLIHQLVGFRQSLQQGNKW